MIAKPTTDNIAGFYRLEIFDARRVTEFRLDESGHVVDTIRVQEGAEWEEVYFTENTGLFSITDNSNADGPVYGIDISCTVPKDRLAIRQFMQRWEKVPVLARMQTNNNQSVIAGRPEEPLFLNFNGTLGNYSNINAYQFAASGSVTRIFYELTSATQLLITPAAPDLLSIAAQAPNLNASWRDNSDNELNFELQLRFDGTSWTPEWQVIAANINSYQFPADLDQWYYLRVRSRNAVGQSDWSNEARGILLPAMETFSLSQNGSGFPVLAFSHTSQQAQQIEIWRRVNGGTWIRLGSYPIATSEFADGTVAAPNRYDYRARLAAQGFTGPWTAEVFVVLLAAPEITAVDPTAEGTLLVQWQTNNLNHTALELERADASAGPWTLIATLGPAATQYSDDDGGNLLADNTVYYYRLRAVRPEQNSPYSPVANGTTLALNAPEILSFTPTAPGELTVEFTDPNTFETEYWIYSRIAGGAFGLSVIVPADQTTAVLTGLQDGTTYEVRVGADNSGQPGPLSAIVAATTIPAPPAITAIGQDANADIRLTLSNPNGATTLEIWRATVDDFSFATMIDAIGGAETTYVDTTYQTDQVYYYFVRGVHNEGTTRASTSRIGAVPAAPVLLVAEVVGADNVLTWQDPSPVDEQQYIERALGPSGFSPLVTVASGVTTYTDTGAGTQVYFYRIRVSAVLGGTTFYSAYSNRAVNVKTFSIKLRTVQVGSEWKVSHGAGVIFFRVAQAQNVTIRWGDGNENTYAIPQNGSITQINEYDYGSEQDVTLEIEFENPAQVISYSMRLVHVNPAGAENVDQKILSFLGLQTFSLTLLLGNRYNGLPGTFFDLPGLTSFSARSAFNPVYEATFPDVIFNKPLEKLDFGGVNIGDNVEANGFEAANMHRIGPELGDTLESLHNILEMPDLPANFNLLVNLTDIIMSMRGAGNTMPSVLREITSLRSRLTIRDYENNIDLSTLTQLRRFEIVDSLNARPLSMPPGWWDFDYSTPGFLLSLQNSYDDLAEADTMLDSIYADVSTHGQIQGGNGTFRNVSFVFSGNATPSGTYQQPGGYIPGSSNGTPQSPQERMWVLVNQYGWTITL